MMLRSECDTLEPDSVVTGGLTAACYEMGWGCVEYVRHGG